RCFKSVNINSINNIVLSISSICLAQVGSDDNTCNLRNIDTSNDLVLLGIKHNNMPIVMRIKFSMRQRHQVGIRPSMGNEQPMRGWIVSLEVKSIKIQRYTWCQWVFLAPACRAQTTRKWNILDKKQPVSRRRYHE